MKQFLTILLSLAVIFAVAQQRVDNPKPISHAPGACPSLVLTPVDGVVVTPADLVESILGTGIVSYSNVTFAGLQGTPEASAGLFTGGMDAGVGIPDGIIMCSGLITNVIGPNASDGTSTANGLAGDADLTAYAGQSTYDATVLEFDFVPEADAAQLFVEFVFGSEEYSEFIDLYNDNFAFFLNGVNIAVVPSTNIPITINTINFEDNSIYYKDNEFFPGPFCNEMDGFTVKMVAQGPLNVNATNTIKLAIADGGDYALDSWVFIKGSGFGTVDPSVPVSNWALMIGIGLILIFAVIRFRRIV